MENEESFLKSFQIQSNLITNCDLKLGKVIFLERRLKDICMITITYKLHS